VTRAPLILENIPVLAAVRRALEAIDYRGWAGFEGIKTLLGVEASVRYVLESLCPIFPKTV